MARGPEAGVPCPDHQHGRPGEIGYDRAHHPHSGRGERESTGPDPGRGPRLAAEPHPGAKEHSELGAHGSHSLSPLRRCAHLAQNLSLAEDHRFQTGGDAEEMPRGGSSGEAHRPPLNESAADRLGNRGRHHLLIVGAPHPPEKLGAMAGREGDRLDPLGGESGVQPRQGGGRQRGLFQLGERGGTMIDGEGVEPPHRWRRVGNRRTPHHSEEHGEHPVVLRSLDETLPDRELGEERH